MTQNPNTPFVVGPNFEQLEAGDIWVTPTGGSIQTLADALSATAGGTVNEVVVLGGPFLTGTTITTAGTVAGSYNPTAHGVLIGAGSSAVTATAAMTNGQLLVGQTGADPLPRTMSGDATLDNVGVLALTATGVVAGTYGDATHVAQIEVDAAGRVLDITEVAISGGGGGGGTVTEIVAGTGLNGGTITTAGTLSANWQAATVTAIGSGVTVSSGTLSATGSGGSVTSVVAGAGLNGGTITSTGTLSANYQAGTLTTIGSGLTLASGTISATGTAGVSSVVAGTGLSGGTITSTGTISADYRAGTLTTFNTGLTLASGTLTPDWRTTAVAALNSSLAVTGGTLGVTGTTEPYTLGIFVPGTMTNSQTLALHQFPLAVTFPSNFGASTLGGSSKAGSGANATSSTTVLISQCAAASDPTNGANFSNIGTVVIGAGGHAGTLTTSGTVAFASGDFMRFMGPGTADATLANFFATLVGNR